MRKIQYPIDALDIRPNFRYHIRRHYFQSVFRLYSTSVSTAATGQLQNINHRQRTFFIVRKDRWIGSRIEDIPKATTLLE